MLLTKFVQDACCLPVCDMHHELCFIILGEMVPAKEFLEAMGESLKDGTLKLGELTQPFVKHGRIIRREDSNKY